MKQILIYVHPSKKPDGENEKLLKLQIENSLELGWEPDDILLATNFPYEFMGVSSVVVSDNNYCNYVVQNTKLNVINELFDWDLIEKVQWLHDVDCYQSEPMEFPDLGEADIGMTDYGRMTKYNMGSVFFKKSARDIFEMIKEKADENKIIDEKALGMILPKVSDRITKINISYNFQPWNMKHCYIRAEKPIKAAHFHPNRMLRQIVVNTTDYFIKGKNPINKPVISDRLIKLFAKYGY